MTTGQIMMTHNACCDTGCGLSKQHGQYGQNGWPKSERSDIKRKEVHKDGRTEA